MEKEHVSMTHLAAPHVALTCSNYILTSSMIYYCTDAQQLGIYLLQKIMIKPNLSMFLKHLKNMVAKIQLEDVHVS